MPEYISTTIDVPTSYDVIVKPMNGDESYDHRRYTMPQSTPLSTYRHNRKLGYSPQASAVTTVQEWADTTTEARDRTNRVRKVCPPSRKSFDIRGYRNG